MKQFKSFQKELKPLVKLFVNEKTGLNLAVNSKEVEMFYYNILVDATIECKHNAIIRYQHSTGSGKWTTKMTDLSANYEKVLNLMGVKFEKGNDAIKGGRHGDYIMVSITERARVTRDFNSFINK